MVGECYYKRDSGEHRNRVVVRVVVLVVGYHSCGTTRTIHTLMLDRIESVQEFFDNIDREHLFVGEALFHNLDQENNFAPRGSVQIKVC